MPRCRVADTPLKRMRGLLGLDGLPVGEGLLIRPCKAIHTCGMRFALDVRFYDRQGRLVRAMSGVRPGRWWIWGGWRAHSALECAAGDSSFKDCYSLDHVEFLPATRQK